jgi:hypothetical protein
MLLVTTGFEGIHCVNVAHFIVVRWTKIRSSSLDPNIVQFLPDLNRSIIVVVVDTLTDDIIVRLDVHGRRKWIERLRPLRIAFDDLSDFPVTNAIQRIHPC